MKFILTGQLVSKKNTWRRGLYGQTYQSKQKEIDAFIWQLKKQTRNILGLPIKTQCILKLCVWGSDKRDLDNEITTLTDILQNSGVIKNDRQVKYIIAKKVVDNKNPRVEIEIN